MKKLKSAVALVLLAAVLMSFSSCSFKFSSFDDLIRPPKLSGKYQGLQQSFEKAVGGSYTLCPPESGEYQSAFVTYDIDSDGDEEAFVFYRSDNVSDMVNFWYFEYADDEWTPVGSYDGAGNSVDKLIFSDLDKDGTSEAVIGWSLLSSKTNKMFVAFSFDRGNIITVDSFQYTYLGTHDINGDGIDDIFTLTVDSSVPEHLMGYARVYNFNSRKMSLSVLSEARTDGNVSSYSSVTTETVDQTNFIYIEALKGERDSITELLYWDDETNMLVSPLFDVETQTTKFSWRNIPISCCDIDSDGFLEIPTSVEMKGSSLVSSAKTTNASENEQSEPLYFIKWVKYVNGKLKPIQYSVVDDKNGYMLKIQSSWVGRITVIGVDGHRSYYRWISGSDRIGDLLFEISTLSKDECVSDSSEYASLGSSLDKNYRYRITDAGKNFGVSDKTLTDNFVITDFGGIK